MRGSGPAAIRSELEAEFRDLVLQRGWPPGVVNSTTAAAGDRFEYDYAWPEARLIVELDSRAHHADWAAQERDRRRDRVLATHGWTVARVSARMLRFERAALVADLEDLIYTGSPSRRRSSAGRALHS